MEELFQVGFSCWRILKFLPQGFVINSKQKVTLLYWSRYLDKEINYRISVYYFKCAINLPAIVHRLYCFKRFTSALFARFKICPVNTGSTIISFQFRYYNRNPITATLPKPLFVPPVRLVSSTRNRYNDKVSYQLLICTSLIITSLLSDQTHWAFGSFRIGVVSS